MSALRDALHKMHPVSGYICNLFLCTTVLRKGKTMAGKGFIGEFKEFISRGNVMDMAIGVIIGGAFSAIVTSLVEDVITPLIGLIGGSQDFSGIKVGPVMLGNFINAIINFLFIALVLFCIIKAFNKARELTSKPKEEAAPTTKICPFCKSEIAIDATRCPHCTSELGK